MQEIRAQNATILNVLGFCFMVLGIMILGSIITIICSFKLPTLYIVPFVGLAIFWGGPLLFFQKKLRKLFSNNVTVRFYEDHFILEIFNRSTGELEKTDANNFKEMQGVRIFNSAKDDSSVLKLYFKTKTKRRYTFLSQNVGTGESNITNMVAGFIVAYNASPDAANRVVYMPNLFATKKGHFYIVILSILFLLVLVMQIIIKPQSIPFTFFAGILLYFQILMQQKRDKRDMEKFDKP